MTATSPGALIREVLKDLDTDDFDAIVDETMKRIPLGEEADYLRALIRDRITNEMGSRRTSAINSIRNYDPKVKGGTATPEATTFVETDPEPTPPKINTAKRDSIRTAFFSQQIPVEAGYIKSIGDLTESDLRYVAGVRYSKASELTAVGDAYLALANELATKHLSVLSDLDFTTVRNALKSI